MRRTSKTLLYFFAVACLAAILSVSLWAAEYDYAHVKTFQDKSVYADITYANGWVQVATSGTKQDADGDGLYVKEGDLPYGSSYRAYFNENTKTLVIEGGGASSSPSANYGDHQNTDGKRNHMFPYWCSLNADKVEHLEFRNIGSLNNGGYIVRPLKSVKTVKMDTLVATYRASKDDTAPFAGLTSLTTLGWGSWDKTTGAWTPSSEYYNEGVVDLRGFIYLQPSGTTSKVPDQILYANSALRSSTSVKEVILPETLTLQNAAFEFNISEVSDGTDKFPKYDGTGNIPSGTVAYRMVNSETGAIAYGTSWQAPSGWAFVKAKAAEIDPYLGQFAGMIPYDFARGAKGLEKVTIPESVNLYRIYSYAFYGCSSLKTIYITGTVDESFVIVNCLNTVIPTASPKGTCTLFLTTMLSEKAWADVNEANYKKIKNKIAKRMIELYEKKLGISVKPYIEEIVIATPATFARYLNTPHGTPYGYEVQPWDTMIARIMNSKNEQFNENLYFIGAHGDRADGYSSAYSNGNSTAGRILREVNKNGKA